MNTTELIQKYKSTVEKIVQLEQYDRYQGAFIFGSVANGQIHLESDIDIVVVVNDEDSCHEVSHPKLNGIRTDVSFDTLQKITQDLEDTIKQGLRKPWAYDAIILFDKYGHLQQLKCKALQISQPSNRPHSDLVQAETYYRYTKPARHLSSSPETANLIMHMQLSELLKLHYKLNSKWWVSDKRVLGDLAEWDPTLNSLLREFLTTNLIEQKYQKWMQIIDHILIPVGGRDYRKFEESCSCERCKADVARLIGLFSQLPSSIE